MPEYRSLWYYKLGLQRWFLPALSAVAAAETMDYFTYENETAAISRFRREFGLTRLFSLSISSLHIRLPLRLWLRL
jgi:hypothetical protein